MRSTVYAMSVFAALMLSTRSEFLANTDRSLAWCALNLSLSSRRAAVVVPLAWRAFLRFLYAAIKKNAYNKDGNLQERRSVHCALIFATKLIYDLQVLTSISTTGTMSNACFSIRIFILRPLAVSHFSVQMRACAKMSSALMGLSKGASNLSESPFNITATFASWLVMRADCFIFLFFILYFVFFFNFFFYCYFVFATQSDVDAVVRACCILQNMMLTYDGFDAKSRRWLPACVAACERMRKVRVRLLTTPPCNFGPTIASIWRHRHAHWSASRTPAGRLCPRSQR